MQIDLENTFRDNDSEVGAADTGKTYSEIKLQELK